MNSEKSLIDLCLGSPVKIRILSALSAWIGKDLSELQLASMSQISGFGVRHALGDLARSGIVTKKVVGRANVWNLNESSYAYAYVGPIVEQIRKVPSSPLGFVRDRILSIPRDGIERIILFGSVVQSALQKVGDIDVAVIIKRRLVKPDRVKEMIEEALGEVSGLIGMKLGKRLEPHIFTADEWDKTRTTPLGVNILKGRGIFPHETD